MKRILTLLSFIFISATSFAQIPQALTYQGIARNAAGVSLTSQSVGLRFSIKDLTATGTTLYSETFTTTTNQFGLFTVSIGTGNVVSGNFSTIAWATGAKYMKVEMDATGGTSYIDMGTSQLISVPYSLVAGSVVNPPTMTLNDLTDVNTSGVTTNQILQWNGTNWVAATLPTGADNWGTQAVVTNSTLSGNGTVATPLGLSQQGASTGQVLKWNGTAWAPGPDNVGASSGSVNVTARLIGDGTIANPLDIAQQAATNGQVLKWGGSSWIPANDGDAQTLNLVGNSLSITGGNSVSLPTGTTYTAGTGISIVGNVISNTGDNDNSTTNEIQALSLVGNSLSLSLGGGSVTLPTGTTYTAGTGISLAGNVVTNTMPDQTVTISSGSGINVTGTYPNFTVAATGGGGGISGSGTTNYLPKFTPNGTTLGNSQLRDDGTYMSINTAPNGTDKLLIVPGASVTGGLKVSYSNPSANTYGMNVTSLHGNSYIGYTGTITFGALTATDPEIYGMSTSGVSAGIFGATSGTNLSAGNVGLSNNWHGGFFGSNDAGGGVGGLGLYNGAAASQGFLGVYDGTVGEGAGVYGNNNRAAGVSNFGVYGDYNGLAYGVGVVGIGFNGSIPTGLVDYGVWGSAAFPGYAVYAFGDLTCTGAKNASVGTSKGNQLVYSLESPGVWFEDFGTATLVNGEVVVNLDPLFLETVFIDATHPMIVTVTPQGDCKGMYVEPGTTSFKVKELNSGTSNTTFSYRITCKRLNYQDHHFGSDMTWGGNDTRGNYQYVQPKPIDYSQMLELSNSLKSASQDNLKSNKIQSKINIVNPR